MGCCFVREFGVCWKLVLRVGVDRAGQAAQGLVSQSGLLKVKASTYAGRQEQQKGSNPAVLYK
jgi:hypothetical protein